MTWGLNDFSFFKLSILGMQIVYVVNQVGRMGQSTPQGATCTTMEL